MVFIIKIYFIFYAPFAPAPFVRFHGTVGAPGPFSTLLDIISGKKSGSASDIAGERFVTRLESDVNLEQERRTIQPFFLRLGCLWRECILVGCGGSCVDFYGLADYSPATD
jgi:hypothetical protein